MTNKKWLFVLLVVIAIIAGIFLLLSNDKNISLTQPEKLQTAEEAVSSDETQISQDEITADEVAEHNSESDCWTIISGNVYDISPYISRHPGGDEILRACGIDATILFTQRESTDGEQIGSGTPHSSSAASQLVQFKIGTVAN
jgi:cytochrome b involved in lipid metabolism